MEKNKEEFLNRIRSRLKGMEKVPLERKHPQWEYLSHLSKEELLEVLKARLVDIHTNYSETTKNDLKNHLLELCNRYNIQKAVLNEDPKNQECGLDLLSKEKGWHIWDSEMGKENIEIAEKSDLAITFAEMTLAESGTIVLHAAPGKGRTTSLLTLVHIALIPMSSLVSRLHHAMKPLHELAKAGEKVPSYVALISGPSSSADIEFKLVIGVHGPKTAHYVVIKDY